MTSSTFTPTALLEAWEVQQTAFVEYRADRTRVMTDVLGAVAATLDHPLRVLDLGCGPGSVSNAVLAAIPDATVVGVDRDPLLMRLFRESTPYPDRVEVLDLDMASPGWTEGLPLGGFDAAVSATALHWLQPGQLARLHIEVARVLHPGGVMLNADHLFFDATAQPFLAALAPAERSRAEERLTRAGAMSWDDWFSAAASMPGWQAEAEAHFAQRDHKVTLTKVDVAFHLASMRAAGFTETAQIWQWLDDRVVFGRMPQH
ncbi:class I SAM-dependent methyltransferase [Acidipropionibacterium virtanenii]|uniref:Trans-aconitate 2-methyltransferase n=1 Tax=Acidipropionibacterium virtanenii TaxID=2057246 RepID=A0A344UPP2_9ACTN|nr:class I SAM-dependent methyltransferase [Acidipropionibacterium virtanenii]AXE37240.1 Trans-aconitate 2-methyltransferase [Acidipropionibacterium virtanenii]